MRGHRVSGVCDDHQPDGAKVIINVRSLSSELLQVFFFNA